MNYPLRPLPLLRRPRRISAACACGKQGDVYAFETILCKLFNDIFFSDMSFFAAERLLASIFSDVYGKFSRKNGQEFLAYRTVTPTIATLQLMLKLLQ